VSEIRWTVPCLCRPERGSRRRGLSRLGRRRGEPCPGWFRPQKWGRLGSWGGGDAHRPTGLGRGTLSSPVTGSRASARCRPGPRRRRLCWNGEKKGGGHWRVAFRAGVPLGEVPSPARPPPASRPPCLPPSSAVAVMPSGGGETEVGPTCL
jgi:hypothetical protein